MFRTRGFAQDFIVEGRFEMNNRFLIAWMVLGLFVAGGCAEGPKVITDFDQSAEFSKFRTFAFSGITDRGYEVGANDNSPLRKRIKDMVDKQLAAKGVRQVRMEDHPDLLVHMFYGVKGQERVQNSGMTPGAWGQHVTTYAYHEGDWVPVASDVTTYEDHEGALIVDLAESSKKKLVWRAVIRAVLGNNLEKNFELADKGITKAFKNYPAAK
jgi:hypothetical protein